MIVKNFSVETAQAAVFDKYGAFFAFSNNQFNEQKKEGVIYEGLASGMVAPVGADIFKELEKIQQEKIAFELANNSLKIIIWDSLANYECQITSNCDDAVEALEQYGINREMIAKEWPAYFQHCVENDYF
ncbi:hypothetical protein BMR05_12615 [Methylococcaceae bacterium HT4]|nr:hypothetical protein BMR10_12715 [Methylococcaceae bacterium CS4]TXK99088.1 hypothetical protein BMR11_07020 [Methylococcaceae bacterium CS5]TXL04077.1 hypothetical protein BMR07_13470 [Methylococcaceae bacterium CS1]TXL06678.1 hypothetical protein BMR09_07705 [Methylococcaceae bacterium CS3]TXL13165.1 hypothetical protein BMR05_12615 [Methylococcaceae bacterium HT4]TXL17108.1 hypothetical protein BMR04_07275 [Methylococcaceae bacterium HT3]TXL19207.1 hypothetical protein BMR06_11030 [Meth